MKKIQAFLFLFVGTAFLAQAQNWCPLSTHQKQYFILDQPGSPQGDEVFMSHFDQGTAAGSDSTFRRMLCKPLLRGGHSDRAADFLSFAFTQTDTSFILHHRALKYKSVPYDYSFPEFRYDSLVQDTLTFAFQNHLKMGSVCLRVRSDSLNYDGFVTLKTDTIINGQADSLAVLTLQCPAVALIHNRKITLSKKHGLMAAFNLANGRNNLIQCLQPDSIGKYDFGIQSRRKLQPGDEIHIDEYFEGGFIQQLDGMTRISTQYSYQVLDTAASSAQVRRKFYRRLYPPQEPQFDYYEEYSDVIYWSDTLNNNGQPSNATPPLGYINLYDTAFQTHSYPARTYLKPFVHKQFEGGQLFAGQATMDFWMGSVIPPFFSPHLVSSPFRFYDHSEDLAGQWEKKLVFYKLGNEEFGSRLVISGTKMEMQPGEIQAYPNPTSGKVYFGMLESPIENLSCWNVKGQSVPVRSYVAGMMADFSSLADGLYHIHLQLKNGQMKRLKLSVSK